MKNKRNKGRGKISRAFIQDSNKKQEFKDNQERFRLLNKFHKQPPTIAFLLATMAVIGFIGIMLADIKDATFKTESIVLLIVGAVVSIGFEQIANLHYSRFSKIANERKFNSVIFNIRLNFSLRTVAMFSLLMLVLAVTTILFKDGTLASLW